MADFSLCLSLSKWPSMWGSIACRAKGPGPSGFEPGAKAIYTMSIEYDLLPDRTSAP